MSKLKLSNAEMLRQATIVEEARKAEENLRLKQAADYRGFTMNISTSDIILKAAALVPNARPLVDLVLRNLVPEEVLAECYKEAVGGTFGCEELMEVLKDSTFEKLHGVAVANQSKLDLLQAEAEIRSGNNEPNGLHDLLTAHEVAKQVAAKEVTNDIKSNL